MTESISNYIDSELKTVLPNFKWRMIKNSKKKLIELYISIYVETNEDIQVQDTLGQNNEPGSVQFEDVICLYDPAYSHVKPQNYLAAIPFDSHVGLEKGYVDALLRQINLTTKQGMVDLKEFLEDDFAGQFKLNWNENNLNSLIKTLKDTNRYENEKLKMVLEDEHSFFEKLKEDDSHDGVERV
ncbi:DUF3013 family protein [Alkalibacterium olivapovliticus]|uniref:Uncharacterized protein n=1 Tax=Alkalibacterium olivapovliticus TaxID=99907 RepID=A0A2T0WBR2_9LACT|nr:DUF3013 family protein [Alkalibacterium olivapovliticus]PRY84138.1 Protein of unknown function (DUF3013) [Alkalibacterium olivapovliticus]